MDIPKGQGGKKYLKNLEMAGKRGRRVYGKRPKGNDQQGQKFGRIDEELSTIKGETPPAKKSG